MNKKPKVIFKDVSKKFTLQQGKIDSLLEIFKLKKNNRSFFALRNVSFTVYEGETIGIIGINGSGKSTMSNLLAQVVPPTNGEIQVEGETSLIAISVGLNNNLTGLENIELKCLMHGMKQAEIDRLKPAIIDFADLGDFIDQPVKNYSSGMKSRLGFAISAHTDPDVMVIDEALSVGDQTFYEKCIKKMNEFKAQGKTIFFISHSISQVQSFCDKAIWIHHGEMLEFGETKTVVANYKRFIKWFNNLNEEERREYKKSKMELQKREDQQTILPATGRSRRNLKEKKEKRNNNFSFIVLFSLFLLSTFLMFFNDNQVFSFGKKTNDKPAIVKSEKSEYKQITVLNKEGYIQSGKVKGYKTPSMKKETSSLSFVDQVTVLNKQENVYKVKYKSDTFYVNASDITIPEGEISVSDLKIAEILSLFPQSFQNAYEYYLVFLKEDTANIQSRLNGSTGEYQDQKGNSYLQFGDIEYRINSDGISDAIIVKNIDIDSMEIEEVNQAASLTSGDEQLIYSKTEEYEYILDKAETTFTIIPR